MTESTLLHELIAVSAQRAPQARALTYGATHLTYAELHTQVSKFSSGLMALGLARGERVAIYLEKRFETVVASFGAPAAGAVFVPVNPILKSEQVGFILRDCNVRVLVTSKQRLATLGEVLAQCPDLRQVVVTDADEREMSLRAPTRNPWTPDQVRGDSLGVRGDSAVVIAAPDRGPGFQHPESMDPGSWSGVTAKSGVTAESGVTRDVIAGHDPQSMDPKCTGYRVAARYDSPSCGLSAMSWPQLLASPPSPGHRVIDTDMVAILYTSGSTGKPKGVVLSHRNMVAGAKSVASYLENNAQDTLLAALPLSFDAGFSQLTTAFHAGARVVLLNYLLPRDVLKALEREKVTGLTAVPPLYIQLSQLPWPAAINDNLRYFANTGGRMPRETLDLLRQRVPTALPFLMYGLTEAFRSTYLPPQEVDRRPDSIGKAIPNAEILVLREDGTPCGPDEPGELVHRGALVGMGYWNDFEKTAERYKLLAADAPGRQAGLQLPEYAVFSGDTVRQDAEGFLYFIGRRDEMMKTSGYRVSPTEVEEILYATQLVGECIAFGVEHESLGHAIHVIATAAQGTGETVLNDLQTECRNRMPAYMVPAHIELMPGPLPRNPNGKIDRKLLATQWLAGHAV